MNFKQKKKILTFLVTKSDKDHRARDAIKNELNKAIEKLKISRSFDTLIEQIELLEIVGNIFPNSIITIFYELLSRLKTIKLIYQETQGISHDRLEDIYTKEKLILLILGSLKNVGYYDFEKTIEIFFEYSIHGQENIQKQAIRGLEFLSRYNLEVFYGDGEEFQGLRWQPQEKILQKIISFSTDERKKYLKGILICMKQILSPSIEGSSSTYNTVTFKTASIPAVEGLIELRKEALGFLTSLYPILSTTEDKKELLRAMHTASQFSRATERTQEVEKMVIENTIFILEFMGELVDSTESKDLQILQTIEHDAYWLYYHMGGLSSSIEKAALSVNEKLKENSEFQIFRVLIGFESIFHDWQEEREKDFCEQDRKIREAKALELAQVINEKNYEEWKSRIISYAAIQSNDMATFPYFIQFLDSFGKCTPKFAIRFLSEISNDFGLFVTPILLGLEQATKNKEISELITFWMNKAVFLLPIVKFLEVRANFEQTDLTSLFSRAILLEDNQLLTQIITTACAQYKKGTNNLIEKILIPAIKLCTNRQYANWVFNLWFNSKCLNIFSDMDEKDYETILENLMWLNKIDYKSEAVLLPIAEKSPFIVIKFFCERIYKKEEGVDKAFEALPFQFDSLSLPLSLNPQLALSLILEGYKSHEKAFGYYFSRLLNLIFPELEEGGAFEQELIKVINADDRQNLFFVTEILRGYDGSKSIHTICKELIKIATGDDELINAVHIDLQNTGVVSGEDGIARAYQEKLNEMKSWLDEPNTDVVLFAKSYIENLERQIEIEKQRVKEDIALRKHLYGSNHE